MSSRETYRKSFWLSRVVTLIKDRALRGRSGTANTRIAQTVKRIHREFNRLEAPFLIASPERTEKDIERSDVSDDTEYAPMTLLRRWRWMRTKSDIISLAERVNRIQTQRIACDASNILM